MRCVRAILLVGVCASRAATAQDARSLEVASVKAIPADSYGRAHQGVKIDRQIAEFGNISVTDLVAYLFHGAPGWCPHPLSRPA
jgi:hypothetical protein